MYDRKRTTLNLAIEGRKWRKEGMEEREKEGRSEKQGEERREEKEADARR